MSIALLAGYIFFVHTSYLVLFEKMRSGDAAAVVAELDRRKIPYRLEDGGARILVPSQVVDATRLSVMSENLPLKGVVGFELFNKSDMGLTEFAQKINYQRALQGELARTIMSLDAVEAARVHLSLPEPSIFRDDQRPPKASVTLTLRAGAVLSQDMVAGVQNLVAASTPDLEAANVFVLNERGDIVSSNSSQKSSGSGGGLQSNIEQYYASKIRRAVSRVYPDSDLDVSVQVIARRLPSPPPVPVPAPRPVSTDDDDAPSSAPPAAQAQPTAADDLENTIQTWTPASRRFALKANLSVTSPISPQLQEQMRSLASEALGVQADAGDLVSVSAAPDGAPPYPQDAEREKRSNEPVMAQTHKAGEAPSAHLSPMLVWEAILAPILFVTLGAAIVLGRRAGGARRLTATERDDYVGRLKVLLGREEANAAPPV